MTFGAVAIGSSFCPIAADRPGSGHRHLGRFALKVFLQLACKLCQQAALRIRDIAIPWTPITPNPLQCQDTASCTSLVHKYKSAFIKKPPQSGEGAVALVEAQRKRESRSRLSASDGDKRSAHPDFRDFTPRKQAPPP